MTDASGSKRPRRSLPLAIRPTQQLESESNISQDGIIDYFAKRGSRLREMEHEQAENSDIIANLKRESERLRSEVAAIKEKARLQAQEDEASKSMYRQEKAEAERLYQTEVGRSAELGERLKGAEREQAAAKAQAHRAETKLVEIRGSFRQEQLTVMAKIQRLENELRSAKLDTKLAEDTSKKGGLQDLQDTEPFIELQRQKEEAVSALEVESKKRRGLEEEVAALKRRAEQAEAAARQAQGVAGSEELVRSLRTELRSQEAAIKEARKMQDRIQSVGILQEKLQAAEARAVRAEKGHSEQLELQSRVSSLEMQLQAWETQAGGVGVDSPQELAEKLGEVRAESLAATAALAEREGELRGLKEEVRSAGVRAAEAEAALHSVQATLAETSAVAARSERRVMLLGKERDGLNRVLASFEAEAMDKSSSGDAAKVTVLGAKLQEAEARSSALEQQKEVLEEGALTAAAALKKVELELADTLAKVVGHEAEIAALQSHVEGLEEQISSLQARLDKGEFNSATTRVLHYVLNPEAEARKEHEAARLAELEAELAVLRLQSSRGGGKPQEGEEPQGGGAAVAALEAELVVTRQKVADLTKRETRLKDVFQQQVANFREAVFCLFGYRVDMATEAQAPGSAKKGVTTFVLKPQHAENGRQQLVFNFRKGKMELLPTEFTTRKLKREVETFVERFKSIPAFTANWTMELFQKQTNA